LADDPCGICGGDGRIGNSFGLTTRCPSCHGTGRRLDTSAGFHDVTKTKPSHHRGQAGAGGNKAPPKPTWPSTIEGAQLATEVRESGILSADLKDKMILQIMEHESTNQLCTQTFLKKMRKQIRPPTRAT